MLRRARLPWRITVLAASSLSVLSMTGTASAQTPIPPIRKVPAPSRLTVIRPAPPEICKLLDDPAKRRLMDGLLFNLAWSCNRQSELGGVLQESAGEEAEDRLRLLTGASGTTTDVLVNDPTGETGAAVTQSETSISRSPVTGTLCSAFNDSGEFYGGGGGFTGFARSIDNGHTWTDNGAVGGSSSGDPSLVWRRADGYFYMATLDSGGGLALWVSTNDCQTFNLVGHPSATGADDKEILAVDNNTASPNYGNFYLVWTNFSLVGSPIQARRSTDGGATWSAATTVSTGGTVQGAWPAVAPNGNVFVAWLRYTDFLNGPITVQVARSTNGGLSYTAVTSPLVNAVSPRDATATANCGRPSLRGNIRYLASPQIAVDASGTLHVVYSYDSDGYNTGDVVNVYYRRSTDNGTTWSPEVRLNDDTTTRDQYFPSVQIDGTTVMAGWYDRRLDANNLLQDYYKRISLDGGVTWGSSIRVSDASSSIVLNPNLATCYHGDYDQSLVVPGNEITQWADDRRGDADVYVDAGSTGRKGMTWAKISHESVYGSDKVGCQSCDPYVGDTQCSSSLPVLCIAPDGAAKPSGIATDSYNGWIGGNIGLTTAVQGTQLTSLAAANTICQNVFGPGWQMAEFHHSLGGWSWSSRGNINNASRFWVYINDQSANCWN
jgi:hypothetical protein